MVDMSMNNHELLIIKLLDDNRIYELSPHSSRSLSFFKKYPKAINIILNNIDSPLNSLYTLFIENHFLNRNGRPYSLTYLSYFRNFIKDILSYLNRSKSNDYININNEKRV
jgi:hypothetical protein